MIITGVKAFSAILSYTGAIEGLTQLFLGFATEPIYILIAMQVTLLIMGTFIDPISMMVITLPIYMPIIHQIGFNPVWFGVIILLNLEVAGISPPYGLLLYTMKGVVSPDVTMGDIIRASLPFFGLMLLAMALVIAFPALALWLPGMMR